MVQYHEQDTHLDIVKIENIPITTGIPLLSVFLLDGFMVASFFSSKFRIYEAKRQARKPTAIYSLGVLTVLPLSTFPHLLCFMHKVQALLCSGRSKDRYIYCTFPCLHFKQEGRDEIGIRGKSIFYDSYGLGKADFVLFLTVILILHQTFSKTVIAF